MRRYRTEYYPSKQRDDPQEIHDDNETSSPQKTNILDRIKLKKPSNFDVTEVDLNFTLDEYPLPEDY